MSKKLKLYCCDQEAVFIDMGTTSLQYYFCKACRKEVAEPLVLEAPSSSNVGSDSDDAYAILNGFWY